MKSQTKLLPALILLAMIVPMTELARAGNSESRNIEFEMLEEEGATSGGSESRSGGSESRNIEFELLLQHCAKQRAVARTRGEIYQASELCRDVEMAAH